MHGLNEIPARIIIISTSFCSNIYIRSWALGASLLGLPVVVAGTDSLVAIITWWHAQALLAAFLAEKHARVVVLRPAASPRALWQTFCSSKFKVRHHKSETKQKHQQHLRELFRLPGPYRLFLDPDAITYLLQTKQELRSKKNIYK